jgi:hypothetical protein
MIKIYRVYNNNEDDHMPWTTISTKPLQELQEARRSTIFVIIITDININILVNDDSESTVNRFHYFC